MSDNLQSKVILWSTPRSLSTVLTKCLSFVPDSSIWFEPYVGAMFYGTDARKTAPSSPLLWNGEPGMDLETQARRIKIPDGIGFDADKCSYKWYQRQLEADYPGKRVVFVKAMANAITTRFDAIPRGYKHSFLIRNPLKVFPSWEKAMLKKGPNTPNIMPATGNFFKELCDLYEYIKDHHDPDPLVLDADDLLTNPGGMLKAYCTAMDIPYSDDLLQWDPSDNIIQTWNIRKILIQLHQLESFTFLNNALSSSKFLEPSKGPSREELSEDVLRCIDFCMPYYEKMYKNRLVC